MTSYPVFLTDRRSGATVDAELIEGIGESQLRSVETEWKPVVNARLRELVAQGAPWSEWPENWHWDWRKKMEKIRGLLAFSPLALICENQVQGLMLLAMAGHSCRLPEQAKKDLVYIDYLETAPWNRKAIVPQPRFGGVGTVMIRAAIEVSRQEDFRGRIGLHSLPAAEEFYGAVCGMTDLGRDESYQGLRYFEMTAAQADVFSR
jgi:hypothetical protein